MKIVVTGDSITVGTYTKEGQKSPNSVAKPNFSEIIKEKLGAEQLINYAINGVSISSTSYQSPEYAIATTIKNTEPADVIIIAAGTNDYGTGVQIGAPDDRVDNSFYGGLYALYSFLKENRSGAKIVVVLPIRRLEDGLNTAGFALEDYRAAIRQKAEQFGFYVFDGYDIPIFPKEEECRKKFILDGLHINEAGHALYAQYLYDFIKRII